MRISDWSSDVCSSDLNHAEGLAEEAKRTTEEFWKKQRSDDGEMAWPQWAMAGRRWRRRTPVCSTATTKSSSPSRRSEERRVGKEGVSTCRSRWSRYH